MGSTPETGTLVIADLTGYTSYLARGELEHAPTIAGDLLETVVGRLEPPFRFAKFEGDAAFLFVEDGRADGPLLFDAIEAAYLGFRRRLRSIERATACDCQACGLAPSLDLKLFVHHGAFVRGRIAGRDELAGPSVILVHRLLKGTTASAAHDAVGDAPGFAVLSAAAMQAWGLTAARLDATTTTESIDPFGTIELAIVDLEARWLADDRRRRIDLDAVTPDVDETVAIDGPPAEVWACLTSPALRSAWEGGRIVLDDPDALRGVGSISRCVTGRLATLEEVVDWQPYEHLGYRVTVPGAGPVEVAYDLASVGGGTALRLRWAIPTTSDIDRSQVTAIGQERRAALERLARIVPAGRGSASTTATREGRP